MKNYISCVLATIDNYSSLDDLVERVKELRVQATVEGWKCVVFECYSFNDYGSTSVVAELHGQRPMTDLEIAQRDDKEKRDAKTKKEQDLKQLAALKKIYGDN